MKILLYEPDERAGSSIYYALHREGYDVCWIKNFSMQNPQSGMRDMTLLLSTLMTMTRMDLI